MSSPVLEQAVATMEVLMPNRTCTSAQAVEGQPAADMIALADAVTAAVVLMHPDVVGSVSGNHAAR